MCAEGEKPDSVSGSLAGYNPQSFNQKQNHHVSGCWEASLPWLETRGCPQGELPIRRFPDDNNHRSYSRTARHGSKCFILYTIIDINELIERAWSNGWFLMRSIHVFVISTDASLTRFSEPPCEVSTMRSSITHMGKLRHGEV